MAAWKRGQPRIPDRCSGCKRLVIVSFVVPLTCRMKVSTWRHIAKLGVAWSSAPGTLGTSPEQGSTGANGIWILHHGVVVLLLCGFDIQQHASGKLHIEKDEQLAMRSGAGFRLCYVALIICKCLSCNAGAVNVIIKMICSYRRH